RAGRSPDAARSLAAGDAARDRAREPAVAGPPEGVPRRRPRGAHPLSRASDWLVLPGGHARVARLRALHAADREVAVVGRTRRPVIRYAGQVGGVRPLR